VLAAGTVAADPGFPVQVWLSPGHHSCHFERDADQRENNDGLGVEAALSADHAAMAGAFNSSAGERSRYAGYQLRPWQWEPAGLAARAGLAIALQIKLRVR